MSRKKVEVLPRTITQLTDADASGALTVQNKTLQDVLIMGTATATPPSLSDMQDGITLPGRSGAVMNTTLAEMFPGEAFVRLWAYSETYSSMLIYQA